MIFSRFFLYPWIFCAIKSIRSKWGLVINIMWATSVGCKRPPVSGYILTTSFSCSKLYWATKPIGPARDLSHIIACWESHNIIESFVTNLFLKLNITSIQYKVAKEKWIMQVLILLPTKIILNAILNWDFKSLHNIERTFRDLNKLNAIWYINSIYIMEKNNKWFY